ncbi:MAG: alcohol acetyltransferase [Termitinemataceae bacterium]|nr:MAG: alcohol acetyltransferase [Termitinemataceae bacterium]
MNSYDWLRLDTGAKLYPSTTTKQESMVFRLVCELNEPVEPEFLQYALDVSLDKFPFYRSVMRQGLFWFYLEKTDMKPLVSKESASPCTALYDENRAGLLFSLTYYHKRVNMEIYHALADATGAANFFNTIMFNYLVKKHKDDLDGNIQLITDDAAVDQKIVNAFDTYYSKEKLPKREKSSRAFCIGTERFAQSCFGIIEGHVSTKDLLNKAHELKASLSEMLVSLLICSFKDSMRRMDEKYPVAITIPVDYRKYFSSSTKRNFIGLFDCSHNFSKQGYTFREVLKNVQQTFKDQLTMKKVSEQMNWYASFEHTGYIKIAPLALKSFAIKQAALRQTRKTSATFSNIGTISMPPNLSRYIRLFSIYCSVKQLYIGVASFLDITTISFTTPFRNTSVQRSFFRALSKLDIEVEIVANKPEPAIEVI